MKQRRFASISVNAKTNVSKRVSELLQGDDVFFSILFSPGKTFLLAGLAVRTDGQGEFRNVITSTISDSDGEITIPVGRFRRGATVEVSFTSYAVNKPASAAALLTFGRTAKQIVPKSGTESVKPGTAFAGEGSILVSGDESA